MITLFLMLQIYKFLFSFFKPNPKYFSKQKQAVTNNPPFPKSYCRNAKKPEWVKHEIIKLKALMPNEGGRKIAEHFNRIHAIKNNMTVGKTYVYETLKKHQYEILVLKRNIKHRRPKSLPKNKIWGLDFNNGYR